MHSPPPQQGKTFSRGWRPFRSLALLIVLGFLHATANAARADDGKPSAEAPTAEVPAAEATGEAQAAELAPILVDADKPEDAALVERSFETPEDVSGFGETIYADPVWRSFETTAELLSESVGAQIKRQGGRDDFATLTLRGAPSGQLRILLDGVALGNAANSVVNLADLPTDTVERIEIYRGFAPVGLSPGSAAGVVNVITRDPKQATASFATGGGSFGSAKVNAGGAGPVAGGSASAFAAYRHTEGDFDYVDDKGSINPNDDDVRQRANNDSDAFDTLLRWRRNLTDTTGLQLRNQVFYKDEGVPGYTKLSPPRARLETVREIAAASVGGLDGRWSLEQNVNWQSQKLTDYARFDNTGETTATTTAARWSRPLGKANWLTGSSEYTWQDFDQQGESDLVTQRATRSSLAVALGDDWTIASLDTTLSFQLRHQQIWNDDKTPNTGAGKNGDHSTDPRVGLRWEPLPGLAVKGNVSSYFRPPTFDELYGSNGFTTGNPALKPETGIAWDAGLEWTGEREPWGKISVGYAYFGSNIDDVILVKLSVDRTARAFNAQKAEIRGHELRMEWRGPAGIALSANFTSQDPENRSNDEYLRGQDLPGLPPKEGYARLSWTHGLFVFAYDLSVSGKHYTDSENVYRRLPTRTVQGLSVVFGPFWRNLRLTLEADNLGNSLVPDEIGYPLPGRSFFATLSWSLPPKDGQGDAK